jgi:hypothetical protein
LFYNLQKVKTKGGDKSKRPKDKSKRDGDGRDPVTLIFVFKNLQTKVTLV